MRPTSTLSRFALAVVMSALAAGTLAVASASATETLAFIPHSGKFPVKGLTAKGGGILFNDESTSYGCGKVASGEGEITGPKTGWLKLRLTECREAFGTSYNSPGAKAEEIITEKVPIQLVYKSKEHHEALIDLNYQPPGELKRKAFMTWEIPSFGYKGCGVDGPVLSPVTPVNTAVLTHKLTLQTEGYRQSPAVYETEAGSKYSAFPETNLFCDVWTEGSIEDFSQSIEISTNTTEGALEIKA